MGPAKCFLPTNWRRRVLIRACPDALGEVLCERGFYHRGERDELVVDLTSKVWGGLWVAGLCPLGHFLL